MEGQVLQSFHAISSSLDSGKANVQSCLSNAGSRVAVDASTICLLADRAKRRIARGALPLPSEEGTT